VKIDPWQVPLLVMASVILLELVIGTVLQRWNGAVARKRMRTAALGLLAALVLGVGVVALGPSLADQLASIAAAVAAIAAFWLTYRSYRAPRLGSAAGEAAAGQPDPAAAPPPAGDSSASARERTSTTP
jgi:hypothetical protein